MTLESALIPIPSEITLPFAGFLAQQGHASLAFILILAIAGDVTGTMILYALGFYLEENVVVGLIKKYGKFILISEHEYQTVMKWMNTKGTIILTIAKLLPGFRTIIGLPAGLSETKPFKAILFTFIGSAIWCTTFVMAGFVLGKNWNSLEPIFRKFEIGIVAVFVVAVLWYINHKLEIIKLKK